MKLNPVGIRKSVGTSDMCAAFSSCFPVGPKAATKRNWIKDKELYLADISGTERVVTPVYFLTDENRTVYMMDAVTGSVFTIKEGRCLTSDHLIMIGFKLVDGLDKRLMKIKSGQFSGSEE
jgi:hypothetical protein